MNWFAENKFKTFVIDINILTYYLVIIYQLILRNCLLKPSYLEALVDPTRISVMGVLKKAKNNLRTVLLPW